MPINLTDENFEKEINNAKKPVLVDFFADWCEPCSVLGPILEKIAEDLKEKIVLLKANINAMPETSQKFGVERIPMVILFINKKATSGFIGLRPEKDIKEWIENELKKNSGNPQEEKVKELISWSSDYAKKSGFKLNPDKKTVEGVIKGLLANEEKYGEKYCPCRRVSGDKEADKKNICPCIYHKDELEKDGHCFCNLFVK
jgi:ferredoxin-thioredoxin reductase catalytic subunit/thiol-disulfide isomerase/thioredoxin